jgi:hypothetical protein
MDRCIHVGLAEALELTLGPPPPGNLAVPVFRRGTVEVELYTPAGADLQQPHRRDEAYFVARGQGRFWDGQRSYPVEAGSFLFVPAGQPPPLRGVQRRLRRLGPLLRPRRRRRPNLSSAGAQADRRFCPAAWRISPCRSPDAGRR